MDSGKRPRWNRKRKRDQRPERNNEAASSSTSTPSSNSSSADSSIPGFYFDQERGRYFRILPEHQAAGSSGYVTPKSIQQRDREAQRQNLLQESQQRPKTSTGPKMATNGSITSLLSKYQLGLIGRERFQRLLVESRVRYGEKGAIDVKVPNDQPADFVRFEFLEAAPDGKTMFGWGAFGGKRLLCLKVDSSGEHPFDVTYLNCEFERCQVDRFTDLQHLRVGNQDAFVYSAILENRDLGIEGMRIGDLGFVGFIPSPLSSYAENGQICRLLDKIIWSCAGMRDNRISVGVEGGAVIFDMNNGNRPEMVLATGGKVPLVQRFSKDESELFMGLRASVIASFDMRTLRSTYFLDQRNVSSIHVMDHPDYILAGNFGGEIKLWDIRMKKVVQSFEGQVNSHTKLPLIVSEEDSLIIAGGEDGTTRCWSLQTGQMLRQIASPYPVNEIVDIPAVCYSNRWGGKPGNSAIVLGAKHELHFHKI